MSRISLCRQDVAMDLLNQSRNPKEGEFLYSGTKATLEKLKAGKKEHERNENFLNTFDVYAKEKCEKINLKMREKALERARKFEKAKENFELSECLNQRERIPRLHLAALERNTEQAVPWEVSRTSAGGSLLPLPHIIIQDVYRTDWDLWDCSGWEKQEMDEEGNMVDDSTTVRGSVDLASAFRSLKAVNKALKDKFMNAWKQSLGSPENEDELLMAFYDCDLDGSGTIDSEELRVVMEKLGVKLDAQQAEEMVVEIDKDKSGEIDYQEFKMFMQS